MLRTHAFEAHRRTRQLSEGLLCFNSVLVCRPIPLLTLDEFILLHEIVQAAAQANPGAVSLLRNVQSTIGRNLLGNLIELGQVAFAPASPDVLQFADYMVQKHSELPLLATIMQVE